MKITLSGYTHGYMCAKRVRFRSEDLGKDKGALRKL